MIQIGRFTATILTAFLLIGVLPRAGKAQEEGAGAGGGAILLREDSHWRLWAERGATRMNPAVLKDKVECEKWGFTERWLKGIEQRTKWLWDGRQYDWTKIDWRDKAVAYMYDIGCPFQGMKALVQQIPPPAGWMNPDFDDVTWMAVRNTPPERAGCPYPYGSVFNWNLYYRSYFIVPDPSQAKDLVLNVTFRGGCRVFVNGKEVARGNLPQGELGSETTGDPYPEEAYRALLEETAEGKTRPSIPDIRTRFIKGLRNERDFARYENFRLPPGHADGSDWLNRAGWDRIMKLRDRKLGPITIPASLLVKGRNVIALEIRGGYHHPIICNGGWVGSMTSDTSWSHCELVKLELKDPAGVLPLAMMPGQGLQAWADDMHSRLYNTDFRPAAMTGGKLRLAGALNGNYSGMVVAWCDKDITGLKAQVSDLSSASGNPSSIIPRSAFSITGMVGEPLTKLNQLGAGTGGGRGTRHIMAEHAFNYAVQTPFPTIKPDKLARDWWDKEATKVLFYDHIGTAVPDSVPAKTAQPLWVSLKIPLEAQPGIYKGSIKIEANGQTPVTLPVEVEVIGWRVPNPQEFQTDVALEQHPYAVANRFLLPAKYKERLAASKTGAAPERRPDETPGGRGWAGPVAAGLPLWSDEHMKALDASFKQLGRVGNDLIYVPVLQRTEFGNWEDSMIKWIRKKDGSLSFDYTNLDRYLDLAVKHLGKPRVICFVVMHLAIICPRPTVKIYNEATGKDEEVGVGWRENPFTRLPVWQTFASQLIQHMKSKGLEKSIYWGHAADHESDAGLITFMREMFPDHYWCASGHTYHGGAGGGGHSRNTVRYFADIYGAPQPIESLMGWKTAYNATATWSAFFAANTYDVNYNRLKYTSDSLADETYLYVHCPRDELHGIHVPIRWRTIASISLHRSYSGVGRMGFDGWDFDWVSGSIAGDWGIPGRPCHTLSWPGKDGADPGARFEVLLEGIQETEARTFLEQAIDRGVVSGEVAAEAKQAILGQMAQACMWSQLRSDLVYDYIHQWQNASRRLYQMAAKVAGMAGVDIARTDLLTRVAALGKTPRAVLLRNWSNQPRAWKAETSEPWLVLSQGEGKLLGFQELPFDVDGTGLKPGPNKTGMITVTDVATGRKSVMKITTSVGDPVELLYDHPQFNVQVGLKDVREYRVVNYAVTEQDWKLAAPVPWIKVEPDSGKLGPGQDVFVKLTATPADREAKTYENMFKFQAAQGMVNTQFMSKTFVIPLFKEKEDRAMPPGRIVKWEDMDQKRFKYHVTCAKGTIIESGVAREKGSSFKQVLRTPSYPGIYGVGDLGNPQAVLLLIGKERFSRGLWVYPLHESIWDLQGSKVTGFSAYVGVTEDSTLYIMRNHVRRVNFEIWVDGKIRTQTGLMRVTDPARYITVEGLEGAKELKLVTRLDSDMDDPTYLATWADACFYEKFDKKDEATGKVIKKAEEGDEKKDEEKK